MQSAQPRPWRPILDGAVREQALDAVADIAEAIAQDSTFAAADGGLPDGHAGISLLYAYLEKAHPRCGAAQLASRRISAAIDFLAEVEMPPALYGGYSGTAWAAAHRPRCASALPCEHDDEQFEAIDAALLEALSNRPWPGHYDLISGLVGIGVYLLSRLPSPIAASALRLIIEHLDEAAEVRAEGVAWLTPPELLPPHRRMLSPGGEYDLGVAHGAPGAIAMLAQACAAGVEAQRARPLVEGAVAWLLAQRIPDSPGAQFGYDVRPGEPIVSARSAWCYGDPGVAAVLWLAATCMNRQDWAREAIDMAVAAAALSEEETRVKDAGLCHGAAGLAHIYNRLHQASGEPRLAEAAKFWFERTLAYRVTGAGVGGYLAWETTPDGAGAFRERQGFLEGAAGIGLALLAAAAPVEPAWDQALLLSPAFPVPA
jgi:lantibiotic modifying enzyme